MYRLFWLACQAVWKRELMHFWRERSRVFGFVGSPLIFWLVVGSGFGDMSKFFAGSLLLSVMFTAVFSTMSVIDDRREGFLLAMLAAPAPRCAIVVGKVLGGMTMSVIQGLLFCLCLPLVGVSLTVASVTASVGALLLTGLGFTSLGFWMAWRSRTSQGFHAMMNIVLMPLWMVSGALFNESTAHKWMKALMAVNPLSYFMAVMQRSVMPSQQWSGPSLAAGIAVTLICGLFFLVLAVRAVERRPQG